jgi:hypothetical protein
MIKYFYLLLFFAANVCGVAAQAFEKQTIAVNETLFVATNTNTFITGETMFCKLFCLRSDNQKPSSISKIAYLELIDGNKKVVFSQKLRLENGVANGDFFIPTTLKSGNYKLIAFTRWMLDASKSNFFESDVIVINPFTTEFQKDGNNWKQAVLNTNPETASDNLIALKTNKKTYGTREKVDLQLAFPANISDNFIVSVRKKDSLAIQSINPKRFAGGISQHITKPIPQNQIAFLPELRGEIISGRISSSTKPVQNKAVALSIPGKSFAFKLVSTDGEGKFLFLLDKNPASGEAVVQVVDEDRKEYQIALDQQIEPDWSALQFPAEFSLNPAYRKDIEQRAVASQIENAYYEQKKDSIHATENALPFFDSVQKEYVLDEFTRFPTLKETITEILAEVSYRKNKGNYIISLKKYQDDIAAFGPPLILVDGLLLQDVNALFDFPAERIFKVSVINEPYVYGPKTFSGVINFTTKDNDFQSLRQDDSIKKTVLVRPLPEKVYFSPDYSKNQNARIPDYRQQLLWLPALETGTRNISFYTSDITGTFEVLIEGFTADGNAVFSKSSIDVK